MILLAILLFTLASGAAMWMEIVLQPPASRAIELWSEHFAVPFARTLCLLLFVAAAYPALFGADSAPPLRDLLRGPRLNHWINLVFLAGVFAPMLPGLNRLPGVLLPLQGCAAVALLFTWLAESRGIEGIALLPTLPMTLALAGLGLLATLIAQLAARFGSTRLADLLRLWLQLPVLLAYGLHLGQRLPTMSGP